MKKLTSKEIKLSKINIFDNYLNFLNNDYYVPDNFIKKDINKIIKKIFELKLNESELETNLEYLFIELIRSKSDTLSKEINWELVCRRFTLIYSKSLNCKKARAIRMKVIRNIFLIREVLDKNKRDVCNTNKFTKIGLFIWDLRKIMKEKVLATSEKKTLKIINLDKKEKKVNAGLPTQIDILPDGDLAIGSTYSNGMFFYKKNGSLVFFESSFPVVTCFKLDNDCFSLRRNGELFRNETLFFNFSQFTNSIWKARFIWPFLMIIDWSFPEGLFRFNIENFKIDIIKIPKILIVNDICKFNKTYYIIDKMQGSVFSFDESFKFLKRKLNFGKEPERLYDPISIFIENEELCIISWLNKYMNKILPF